MRTLVFFAYFLPLIILAQTPKLVVGVVVDQMCYDYLYRFQHHFSTDGFRRFLDRGVNCRNTNYNYVPTYTGPGHASIYTGTTPYNHGIVGNDWYNRSTQQSVYCVFDAFCSNEVSNLKPYGDPFIVFLRVLLK
jgi:predicted AlkP superfamily pyrophosphatase or phosphodiesterase